MATISVQKIKNIEASIDYVLGKMKNGSRTVEVII